MINIISLSFLKSQIQFHPLFKSYFTNQTQVRKQMEMHLSAASLTVCDKQHHLQDTASYHLHLEGRKMLIKLPFGPGRPIHSVLSNSIFLVLKLHTSLIITCQKQ